MPRRQGQGLPQPRPAAGAVAKVHCSAPGAKAAQQSKLEAMRKDKDKLIHELQRKLKAKESGKGKPEGEDKDAD